MMRKKIFAEEYRSLSTNAKWLYAVLNELERRLTTGEKADCSFYQSDSKLSEFSGIKRTALKEAKKELKERGLVETWQAPLKVDGKWTRQHITHYRVK